MKISGCFLLDTLCGANNAGCCLNFCCSVKGATVAVDEPEAKQDQLTVNKKIKKSVSSQ